MSGICGIVDFTDRPVAFGELDRMAASAAHRGPDGIRRRTAGGTAFCHLALHATFESTLERQPLSTPDGAVWLVADLRLDNREELIRALEPAGLLPPGRPAGDGEILLAAFLEWGAGCVERLLGDFAFAVWDSRSRTVICARDPLGVKPLCFARIGDLFVFASEAQQILLHPAIDRSFDELALADYLAGWPQTPGRSFFRQIRRLPAGHRLIAGAGGDRLERTWAPEWIQPERRSPRSAVARFRELFEQAVDVRLRTQGTTIGISLSGGLDSTSIAAVAQRRLLESPEPARKLLAYSFVFDRLQECDEKPYIQALTGSAGFEAAFIQAEDRWLLDDPELYAAHESPFQGWLSCHLQGLRLLAGRGARVLLTGQGADDLLQGSPLVLSERFRRGDARVVAEAWRHAKTRGRAPWRDLYRLLIRPMLPRGLDAGLRRFVRRALPSGVPEWISPGFARRTGIADRLQEAHAGNRRDMARGEISFQLALAPYEQAVHWLDRVAAPFGIEVRHPFLDRRLAESVLAMPPAELFELGWYKPLLRRAMTGILPDTVRLRPTKTRLGSYVDLSLRERAGDLIEEIMDAPLIADLGFVDGQKLRAAFRAYRQDGPTPERRKIWYAVTLELWLRRHRDGAGVQPAQAQSAIALGSC